MRTWARTHTHTYLLLDSLMLKLLPFCPGFLSLAKDLEPKCEFLQERGKQFTLASFPYLPLEWISDLQKESALVWMDFTTVEQVPQTLSMNQVWENEMGQQGSCCPIISLMNNHLFHPITVYLIWFFSLALIILVNTSSEKHIGYDLNMVKGEQFEIEIPNTFSYCLIRSLVSSRFYFGI